jgi:hypothetical protein
LIGSTFSCLPNSSPFFMAGSPSILQAFLNAQYLMKCQPRACRLSA